MAKWMLSAKKADFKAIGKKYNIDPVIARIIRNRDILGDEEINGFLKADLKGMHSPYLLKDMQKAVDIIMEAITDKEKIRVIGDYDADGICSSYILKEGLSLLNADVDVRVPNRIKDGYGLNESMIEEAKAAGIDMIITCDNGIAASDAICLANSLGITVVVTDHHEVPFVVNENGNKEYRLPPAYAVINPKQEECNYPFSGICGAMVAYKLIQALYEVAGKNVPEIFLELAAFATICDVMELKDENRIAVKYGLLSMKHTENMGLKALFQVCEIKMESIIPYHIGFVCGPCFNATGRLDIADRAVELLCTKDFGDAVLIARELKELNEQRKSMTLQGVKLAEAYIMEHDIANDDILVIYLPTCHESIAGIVAGRIKDQYYKPVIVLTNGEEEVKGSGRSIEAYDMYESLSACQEYFIKFGGHKMAAGLSLKEENIEPLRKKLNKESRLNAEDFEEKILIDVPMPISYVTENLIHQLELLEPFGTGNPKPVFAQKGITVLSEKRFGKEKNVGKYRISDGYDEREMVYFGDLDAFSEFYKSQGTISIAYYPTINEYRNEKKIQIVLNAYKEV
ncbi:MAG: single-stranded-DNA-specific exonuclease RecJ [Lachnospiraceae bacterium]|nr:single-stranded-DNA-specific exonuclease RecJ [Lachnospiraceae bacterium]